METEFSIKILFIYRAFINEHRKSVILEEKNCIVFCVKKLSVTTFS